MKNSLDLYKLMFKIRYFEDKVSELVETRKALTPCHLYTGQEAIAVGVCSVLRKSDSVWGNHRSHGHFIAKGGSLREIMAEILCKKTGSSHGRGGSMHLISSEHGIMGTVPIVAATIPLSVGAGLAYKIRHEDRVSVSFFGDGATEEGHFHESVNLASLYKLPVIFVCENNYYASHMSMDERRADNNLSEFGKVYRINSIKATGNDLDTVIDVAKTAVKRARNGEGPSFLEFETYRWKGHVGHRSDIDVGVLRKDELQKWLPKDPIANYKKQLISEGFSMTSIIEVENEVKKEVQDSLEFALQSDYPSGSETLEHVYVGGK